MIFLFIMFGGYLLQACFCLMRDRQGVDLERRGSAEELGGLKGRKTITRISCIRKVSIFN